LRWEDRIVRAPGATIDFVQFRGNSLFDPSVTVGTGQPTHFDEWAFFYNRYRVRAAKFTCWIENTSTVDMMGVLQANDESPLALTSYDEIRRGALTRGSKSWFRAAASTSGRQSNDKKIVMYQTIKSMIPFTTEDAGLSANIGANPNNGWTFTLQAIDVAEATNITWIIKVMIDYFCEFSVVNQKPAPS